jgi:hypothetical protein
LGLGFSTLILPWGVPFPIVKVPMAQLRKYCYLSDLLAVGVDVAIKKNLRKRIGERILSEVVPL